MVSQQALQRVKLPFGQIVNMLGSCAKAKVVEQIKTVALIVAYLVLFQLIVLNIPLANALVAAMGIGVVFSYAPGRAAALFAAQQIFGLSGVVGGHWRWHRRAVRDVAPSLLLVAKALHLRVLYAITGSVSFWAYFDPNLVHMTGLAWDCGGVTTGQVTVPLVLALGIGISLVATQGGEAGAAGGFGVVTRALAFPIVAVMELGLYFLPKMPAPASDAEFCGPDNRYKALYLFVDEADMQGYVITNGSAEARRAFFAGAPAAQVAVFGSARAFSAWLLSEGSVEQRLKVYGSEQGVREEAEALYASRVG